MAIFLLCPVLMASGGVKQIQMPIDGVSVSIEVAGPIGEQGLQSTWIYPHMVHFRSKNQVSLFLVFLFFFASDVCHSTLP